MPLILNMDTSTDYASVCLARDGEVLLLAKNDQQKDHAAWLHPAIKKMMQDARLELSHLDAVAVTIGPGSYTGLRVGLATAKGICYALGKPLIVINTLLVMAYAAKEETSDLLCPMIDARRMEVFTAVYNHKLEVVKEPLALVIDENSFDDLLASNSICFFGNGSEKLKGVLKNQNAGFSTVLHDAASMIKLAEDAFMKKQFANLAYSEPLYLKEFYTPGR